MLRILRHFSITSLVTIIVAAVLLVVLYREIAIRSIIHLGEQNNVSLAQTALNPLEDTLIEYLNRSRLSKTKAGDPHTLVLAKELDKLMHDSAVVRIKLLDSRGIVVFSTKEDQIGDNENSNPGYEAAIAGKVASRLIYRDSFNPFDQTTGDENLIQTYLPVRQGDDKPIRGVFEVYTDVSNLVAQVERMEKLMILGAIVIMGMVYFSLLFIVRRADRLMEAQRQTIYERSQALEMVSAQLFTAQESERKRLADGLHEGLVQDLAGIKMKMEAALHSMKQKKPRDELPLLQGALNAIDRAIDETRSLAMELRPSSLDALGLVDTLEWYVKQLQEAHPSVSISLSIDVDEADVPAYLRTSIYRVVEEVFGQMLRQPHISSVLVRLKRSPEQITLTIGDTGQPYRPSERSVSHDDAVAAARERVLLSGGTFIVESTPWGALRISASWPLYKTSFESLA